MRKRFPGEMTVLGGFEMTSQTMRVSDPCYDRDVWCCGTFGKCKTGTWEAGVLKTDMGDWGVRCAVLAVRHKETGPDYSVIRQRKVYQMKDGWLEQPIDVGVDSGQAGFYDEAFYQDNSIFKGMPEPEHDYGDLWYNHACDITLSEMSAGVMPYGVVSSSGFGDGSYAARPVVPAGPTQEELDAEYIRICQSYDPTSEEWTVDRYNRRWIMCTVCGRIKQDVQMSYYGGKGGTNRGVCADCSRNGRS